MEKELSDYEKELLRKCNEFKDKLIAMDEKDRDEYVEKVLDWLFGVYEEFAEVATNRDLKSLKKLKELSDKYGKEIDKRRHIIIVCLTYAIKEKFQRKFAPLFVSVFSML